VNGKGESGGSQIHYVLSANRPQTMRILLHSLATVNQVPRIQTWKSEIFRLADSRLIR
jgi:hypothetical protein